MRKKSKKRTAFSRNIRAIRKKTGLTQEQFARRIGVSTSTLRAWEQSVKVPSNLSLEGLAARLGVQPSWLTGSNVGL